MADSQNYYKDQVDQVDFTSKYYPRIKIQGDETETKWMDLNKDCAKAIILKLIEVYNIKL